MPRPGHVRQPGAAREPRVTAVAAHGRPVLLHLAGGTLLVEAVRQALADVGATSALLDLRDLDLGPFGYVMPALAGDSRNAAYYSAIHRPAGLTRLSSGAMTFGSREGAAFFHAHGLWTEANGRVSGGHLLPEETVLARPATVAALALDGAGYHWAPDPEIHFTVPGPVACAPAPATATAVALRVRPNIELHQAIEDYCAAAGITAARIRGGVGSTIGALFDDGREVSNFATEVYIERGEVVTGATGRPEVTLDVGLIDFTGAIARGRLRRGANSVLMTFELGLQVDDR